MKVIVAEKKDDEGFWTILCPREGKRIPIYQCIGSLVRVIKTCVSLKRGTYSKDAARVTCLWPEERIDLY
uniref:Uncharacterized protein n=1 Tax=viral metagenome TaxID=1070528 RepID=A0A6M3LUV3_9ZZZZ